VARERQLGRTKPVRIVVPFNSGGAIDALARGMICDALTTKARPASAGRSPSRANTIVGSEIVAEGGAGRLTS